MRASRHLCMQVAGITRGLRKWIAITVIIALLIISVSQPYGLAIKNPSQVTPGTTKITDDALIKGAGASSALSMPSVYPLALLPLQTEGHKLVEQLQSTIVPSPSYDEQLGETFTQDVSVIAFNVTAVAQAGGYGYGPAYLLAGLSNTGYWYEVGISFNWPNSGGGYNTGFNMNYEVFDPNGNSVYPTTGGGGLTALSGPVNPGDRVLLDLYFSPILDAVVMYVYDWNTGASALETYSTEGATYFVGLPFSIANSNGFFTGLMTEWYHVFPYFGNEQDVTYSESGFSLSSAWLWVNEFNAVDGQGLFTNATSQPITLSSELHPFFSFGASVYASSYSFVSGLIPVSFISFSSNPITTDAGLMVTAHINLTIDGGVPPYTYAIYLGNGTEVYNVTSTSSVLIRSQNLGKFSPGIYSYYVGVVSTGGETVYDSTQVPIIANEDPTISTVASTGATDQGIPISFIGIVSGGTPPYTYSWYVNGSEVGGGSSFLFDPASPGSYVIRESVTDSAGLVANSTPSSVVVNPDPVVNFSIVSSSNNFFYEGNLISLSAHESYGTQPLTYAWYLDGVPISHDSDYNLTLAAMGNYVMVGRVEDAAGYTVASQLTVVTFSYNYTNIAITAAIVAAALIALYALIRRRRKGRSTPKGVPVSVQSPGMGPGIY